MPLINTNLPAQSEPLVKQASDSTYLANDPWYRWFSTVNSPSTIVVSGDVTGTADNTKISMARTMTFMGA